MKYLPVFLTFFAGAFAQGINFSIPKDSSTIPIGENLISINQPNTATGLENVAIVISIGPCSEGTCPDPNERLGMTLYSGPFNPQYPAFGTPDDQPQQNFTIDVPQNLAGKQVQLSAVLFALIGAGPAPFYSVKNITAYVEYS